MLRTAFATLVVVFVFGAVLWEGTDGLRAFTAEGARRLSVTEQPRPVPAVRLNRSEGTSEMARFVGTKVEFRADTDEFALDIESRELPLTHADPYLNKLILKDC